jgi:hypothetical protein
MEENTIYDKLVDSKRGLGRLQDAAFAQGTKGATQSPGSAKSANPLNMYLYSTKIGTLVCPSFPGEEDVAAFGSPVMDVQAPGKIATGNYMAIASTHYHSGGDLESGLPPSDGAKEGKNCTTGAYCGNGGMPFPGLVSGRVQKTGLGLQSLSDGTSKVPLVTESREEQFTSWYSGFASYVVAAWPNPGATASPEGEPSSTAAGAPIYWQCVQTACDIALNKGDTKGDVKKYYQGDAFKNPHNNGNRIWGPSSRHPSIVLHGFGDAHSEAVNDQIDKNAYLQMVTRSGREVGTTPQ